MPPSSKSKLRIVEFSGLTGSGKTTLLLAVKYVLAGNGIVARDAYDVVLARYGLNLARYPKLRSLVMDVVAFLPFLRYVTTQKGLELLVLAIRVIIRDAGGFLVALDLGRNFAKRIGVYILLTRLSSQSVDTDYAICDEGVLQIAHNLFVHVDRAPDPTEITHFSRIVPKPDRVIWVRAAQEQSIEVILQRGHSRVDKSRNSAKAFVEHGYATFNILSKQEGIKDKLFSIDNTFNGVTDRSTYGRAQGIAAFLTQDRGARELNG